MIFDHVWPALQSAKNLYTTCSNYSCYPVVYVSPYVQIYLKPNRLYIQTESCVARIKIFERI